MRFSTRLGDVLTNLARQGRVAALAALHQISLKCRFQALREAAEQILKDFAREQSQSLEQILDQVVPDCGFDASGKRYLAIAEEQWLICIDAATWKAVLQSPDGKSQNKWPTSAGKEQEKAWKSLKKEIDGLMQSQILRLERAMVQMQSWELSRFNDYLVRHPLLRHLLPTLIWGWQAEEQGPWKSFQLVYQVSFAPSDSQSDFLFLDVSGQAFKAEQGHIRLLHPLEFQGERVQWKARFMSIKQPFDQIERKLFWPDAADSATSESPAFAPRQVSAARLLQLSKKGLWKSLGEGEFERYFGSQRVMICSEIAAYALSEYKEVELFYIHALNEGHQKLPMAVLDPISYSELRRDLDWIGV